MFIIFVVASFTLLSYPNKYQPAYYYYRNLENFIETCLSNFTFTSNQRNT